MIERLSIYGSNNIGVFFSPTDKYVLIPSNVPQKIIKVIEEVLKTKVVQINICDSVLLGVLSIGNSKGLLLPYYASKDEVKFLRKELEVNVEIFPNKRTALGNIILANDYAAIVSPELDKKAVKVIKDVLDVEIESFTIAGYNVVGSVGAVNNKGCIVHPMATEEELKNISEILKVKVDVGTVNAGFPVVGVGIVANSNGILVGSTTTGPEIAHIERSLGF
ncbi:MAG: translation initiation factor IF-6 [Candidatus Methanomethylicia archaeon]